MGTDSKVKSSKVYGSQQRYVYKPLPKMKLNNCKNCK